MIIDKVTSISVIVLSIGRRDFIKKAIKSVLDQRMRGIALEIIVLKDFADLEIEDFLKKAHVQFHNLKIVNQGEVTSKALEYSTGDILCFLDDDDLFLNGKLIKVARLFESEPVLGYYHNAFLPKDISGNVRYNLFVNKGRKLFLDYVQSTHTLNHILSLGAHINMSSISIKREILEDIRPFIVKIDASNDDFLLYAAINNDYKIAVDTEPLTIYTIHNSNSHSFSSFNQFSLNFSNRLAERIRAYKIIESYVRKEFLKKSCKNRISRDMSIMCVIQPHTKRRDVLKHLRSTIKNHHSLTLRLNTIIFLSLFIVFLFGKWGTFLVYIVRTGLFSV